MYAVKIKRAVYAATVTLALILVLNHPANALSLEEAVRDAFEANPALRAAEQRVAAAQAATDAARSAWWPRLSVSAGYDHSDNPPQAFMMRLNQGRLDMMDPAFDPNRTDGVGNASLTAGAQVLLYDGGARGLRLGLAADAVRQGLLRHEAVRNALAYEVVRAWYGLLRAQAFLGVQEQTVESLESLLAAARERRAAGTAVQTDVLNLEVRLAETREDWIRTRNGVRLAVEALNMAIGRERVSLDALPPVAEIVLPEAPGEPEPDAYRQHPEWRATVVAIERARDAVHLARREGWPRVRAFGVTRRDGEGMDDGRQSYAAGVAAEWDAFTGFERRSGVRRAVAESSAAEAELETLGNRLRFELREAAFAMTEARERIDVAGRSVAGAAESLRITGERYAEGSAPISEWLLAQVADSGARIREVTARYDYCVAIAHLQRAQGTLADRFAAAPAH